MTRYRCNVCNVFEYDDSQGNSAASIMVGTKPDDFPEGWKCPVCFADKTHLMPIGEGGGTEKSEATVICPHCGKKSVVDVTVPKNDSGSYLGPWKRSSDDLEIYMDDIHKISETDESITEPMRTVKNVISWDDILVKGAQLAKIPLNKDELVSTRTVIGPRARQPLVIETPIYITHMSFGALSKEVKIALAKGSAAVKTAMCSGEGGI
ncbi:MAG: rubredoxin, partial [Candidatus Aenigmarchaeota archaeon]|nr:rubredoxin [Candidatus Aenigmarchaeota archaeon]